MAKKKLAKVCARGWPSSTFLVGIGVFGGENGGGDGLGGEETGG
jgi:hypothetical protein